MARWPRCAAARAALRAVVQLASLSRPTRRCFPSSSTSDDQIRKRRQIGTCEQEQSVSSLERQKDRGRNSLLARSEPATVFGDWLSSPTPHSCSTCDSPAHRQSSPRAYNRAAAPPAPPARHERVPLVTRSLVVPPRAWPSSRAGRRGGTRCTRRRGAPGDPSSRCVALPLVLVLPPPSAHAAHHRTLRPQHRLHSAVLQSSHHTPLITVQLRAFRPPRCRLRARPCPASSRPTLTSPSSAKAPAQPASTSSQ